MNENSNWKTSVYLIGGIAGLIAGLAAAFFFIRTRDQEEDDHRITSSQGMKIGMGVVSLLRMFTEKNP